MREIRTLRVMWRELETELRQSLRATAPVPDPTTRARVREQFCLRQFTHQKEKAPENPDAFYPEAHSSALSRAASVRAANHRLNPFAADRIGWWSGRASACAAWAQRLPFAAACAA